MKKCLVTGDNFPQFTYHPNPFFTSSIILDKNKKCICCGKVTGYIYTGAVYSIDDLSDSLCPWCIANGAAHEKFDAKFISYIGGSLLNKSVEEELLYRTPAYSPWQSVYWHICCNEPAEYWGTVDSYDILKNQWGSGIVSLRENMKNLSDEDFDFYIKSLSPDGLAAYIFRCKVCREVFIHTDCD